MYAHPSLISSFDASGPWQPDAPGQPVARLHIFKAGLHTSGNGITRLYTADELAAMAAAYDPARFAAPLVIGHPQDNAPAYGWVARLVAEGDDLFAEVDVGGALAGEPGGQQSAGGGVAGGGAGGRLAASGRRVAGGGI